MADFTSRLADFLEIYFKGNKASLARAMQVSPQSLTPYFKGSEPGAGVLKKLYDVGCNVNWLLTGVGEMSVNKRTAQIPNGSYTMPLRPGYGASNPESLEKNYEKESTLNFTKAMQDAVGVSLMVRKKDGTYVEYPVLSE